MRRSFWVSAMWVQLEVSGGSNSCRPAKSVRDGDRAVGPQETGAWNRERLGSRSGRSPAIRTPHVSTQLYRAAQPDYLDRIRRFTWKTNAFSKRIDRHRCAVALGFAVHNFVQIHTDPGGFASDGTGISDRLWSMEDVAGLIDPRTG